jgi:hypothetical protein
MTSSTLVRSASTLAMFALTGALLVACGGKSAAPATTPAPGAGSAAEPAACSVEECAKAMEPPISPSACGDGHEKDIGTVCKRVPSGECQKVLQCAGADPVARAATPAP